MSKTEVSQLAETGAIWSSTVFLDGVFRYGIETTEEETLSASFQEGSIVLRMPEAMIQALVQTDIVGFDGISGPVKLLVEKDFVCLDKTDEDQTDNYPNPNVMC